MAGKNNKWILLKLSRRQKQKQRPKSNLTICVCLSGRGNVLLLYGENYYALAVRPGRKENLIYLASLQKCPWSIPVRYTAPIMVRWSWGAYLYTRAYQTTYKETLEIRKSLIEIMRLILKL